MESLLTKLASGKLSSCAAIILMFTYSILLDRDFACTCKSQNFECVLYLVLPAFIILLLILWTDASFQRVCRYMCSSFECRRLKNCSFWVSFLIHILKAALVGLLWVAFVFLDGDWYVCCMNNHSEQQAPLACKAKEKKTEKEEATVADLKNTSRVIGGFTLFGIVLVAFLMPFCLRRKCCEEKLCDNRRFLYDKLILAEEDNVLKEILRKSAKDQLTVKMEKKICSEQWEDCFDVAVDMINESAKPIISEGQQRVRDADNETLEIQQDNNQHEEQEASL